jgi:plasmid replication initiation protein
MRKFFSILLKKILGILEKDTPQTECIEEEKVVIDAVLSPKINEKQGKSVQKKKTEVIPAYEKSLRDFTEMMENPFLSLSKNRKTPIIYESSDGTRKVKVTRHTGHFLASIYDWDIVIFVASKMQEILNSGSDIPPRTMIVPRHEMLKAIHKHNVKKQQKDLENSLHRLKRTAIDTTIRNEDGRYKSDFGFIDSWDYTERQDKKEIRITLSQWLYDGICAKGTLLKVDSAYFSLTSAIKRFLYRTARKHVGKGDVHLNFSTEKLYEKSGSEREFRKFKSDLKAAVLDNDIPGYTMRWIQRRQNTFVEFSSSDIKKTEPLLEKLEETTKDNADEIHMNTSRTFYGLDNHVDKIH